MTQRRLMKLFLRITQVYGKEAEQIDTLFAIEIAVLECNKPFQLIRMHL